MSESVRIASEEQIAAAAEAVALGEALSREYWQAAESTPGVGWQVSLPSQPDSQGQLPQGEGFGLPADSPAFTAPRPLRLIPQYGLPATGGAGYHNAEPGSPSIVDGDGIGPEDFRQPRWRPSRSAIVLHVSPRSRPPLAGRIRRAWRALTGR